MWKRKEGLKIDVFAIYASSPENPREYPHKPYIFRNKLTN